MQIDLDNEELKILIKCLIALKVMAIIFKLDYEPIKNLLVKLNYYKSGNVFNEYGEGEI